MSHLIQGLHMLLTPPVMQRCGLGGSRRPPGGAGRESAGERVRGAAPFVGGPAARPLGLRPPHLPAHSPSPAGWSRSGSVRTPGPRESTLFGLRKQSIQTSIRGLVYGEAGRGGAAASTWPPARPAPRRRTCDRCAAAPVAGRAGRPRHPRPRARAPPGAPGPSAGRGAPLAPAHTHIAPQLLLGGRFPQPAGAHHVAAAAAAHAAGRPEPAAGSGTRARAAGSAGRRCAARGEGEGPGRPAAAGRGRGRGRGGAARLPRARPRLLPARPRRGRPGRKGGARSPRPQPAAPPGGPPAETRTPPRASDPALWGAPAARRAPRVSFSEASGSQRGRRPRPWWAWGNGHGLRALDGESTFRRGSSARGPRAAPLTCPFPLRFRFQWVRFWLK